MTEWILCVAGGLLQLPVVEAAHELGFNIVVSDRNLECACAGIADHFVELDTFDEWGHKQFVKEWPYGFAAVFTAGADPIVTVAKAAEAAGCHGIPVEIALRCADKSWTRILLGKHGVAQPKYALVEPDKLGIYTDGLTYPSIIKATTSSGSRGHTRLDGSGGVDALQDAIAKAGQYSEFGRVITEELLTGIELSVESLWYDGVMIPLNAVERPFMEGTNIELGHYNPWLGSAYEYAAVWDIVGKAGCAVGMDRTQGGHIFKADLIYTEDGPKVLELTTRLSGGFDSATTTPLAHGANYIKGALCLALGRPLAEAMQHFAKRWHSSASAWAILGPPEGGIIKEIKGLDKARKSAEQIVMRYSVGDRLPPLEDCASRAGFAISKWVMAESAANCVKVVCE